MEIALASGAGNRVRALFGAALLGWVMAVWAVLLIALAFGDPPAGSRLVQAAGLAVLLALTVFTGAFLVNLLREVFIRSPRLLLESGRLVVENRALLKKPVVLDRADVVAVSIRAGDGESWWGDDSPAVLQLLMEGGLQRPSLLDGPEPPEGVEASILDTLTFTLVPVVTHDPTNHPNVALHLRRPLDLRRHRRFGTRTTIAGGSTSSAAAKPGLLLSARDPAGARDLFATWGVERKLGLDQAELLLPAKQDLRRFRRKRILRVVAFVYFGALVIETLADGLPE